MGIKFNLDTSIAAIAAIMVSIAARWVSIFIPVGYLSKFRKFNSDVLIIMTWGGLRGGISIALALSIQGKYHDLIVTITYAVVIFSMIVQGLTIGPLVSRLTSKDQKEDDNIVEEPKFVNNSNS